MAWSEDAQVPFPLNFPTHPSIGPIADLPIVMLLCPQMVL